MEPQWPLIIFTVLTAWAAGLFATQAVFALKGEGRKSQLPALVTSMVILAVGGIAVFTHLQHWERIFNGFGHLTSGITQELIAVVVLVLVALAYFICLRKSGDGSVPKAMSVVAVAAAAVLLVTMAHSYMMASRPAWNSVLWVLCVIGNACAFGPASFAVIMELVKDPAGELLPKSVLVGTAVNVVTSLLYVVALQLATGAHVPVGYYVDPTDPSAPMVDPSAGGVFGEQAVLVWLFAILLGAVAPAVLAFMAKRGGGKLPWKVYGTAIIVALLVGAVCIRIAFYQLGSTVIVLF